MENVLDGPYYQHSKYCLKPLGLWPYHQNALLKAALQLLTTIIVLTILVPLITKAYEFRHDFDYLSLSMISLVYYMQYVTKFFNIIIRPKEFKNIMERIKSDFEQYQGASLRILQKYSDNARKFNTLYTMYFMSSVTMFNSTAFLPHTLDFIFPLNESRPRNPVRLVRYFVPRLDESFYFALLHGMIIDFISMMAIIGFDMLMINCAQHACALFKIVVLEIRSSTEFLNDDGLSLEERQKQFYRRIVKAMKTHKHALEFVDIMDRTFRMANFIMIGVGTATVTVAEFKTIAHKGAEDLMFRYFLIAFGELLAILYQHYPGQRIMDHSSLVEVACGSCEWYREEVPVNGKKLLVLMLLRSQKPCFLTAGKLFVLDLRNYVNIFRASLSYFAFLRSTQ